MPKNTMIEPFGLPQVIHQLVLNGVDSPSDPVRWRQYWWDNFKRVHPDT